MKWETATKPQQDYARRLRATIGWSVSQNMKYLDDAAAYDRGEIDTAELERRTGNSVAP